MSVISVPSRSMAAWRKYRESVHSRALSAVTTSVPAEPSKPEKNVRSFQWGETYSL